MNIPHVKSTSLNIRLPIPSSRWSVRLFEAKSSDPLRHTDPSSLLLQLSRDVGKSWHLDQNAELFNLGNYVTRAHTGSYLSTMNFYNEAYETQDVHNTDIHVLTRRSMRIRTDCLTGFPDFDYKHPSLRNNIHLNTHY